MIFIAFTLKINYFIRKNTNLLKLLLPFQFLFPVIFPCFCPQPGHPETSIEKQEDGKNDFNFFGKILKPRTDKHIYPQNEIKQDDEPGEVLGEFLHGITV